MEAETARATAAEEILRNKITDEATARSQADAAIWEALSDIPSCSCDGEGGGGSPGGGGGGSLVGPAENDLYGTYPDLMVMRITNSVSITPPQINSPWNDVAENRTKIFTVLTNGTMGLMHCSCPISNVAGHIVIHRASGQNCEQTLYVREWVYSDEGQSFSNRPLVFTRSIKNGNSTDWARLLTSLDDFDSASVSDEGITEQNPLSRLKGGTGLSLGGGPTDLLKLLLPNDGQKDQLGYFLSSFGQLSQADWTEHTTQCTAGNNVDVGTTRICVSKFLKLVIGQVHITINGTKQCMPGNYDTQDALCTLPSDIPKPFNVSAVSNLTMVAPVELIITSSGGQSNPRTAAMNKQGRIFLYNNNLTNNDGVSLFFMYYSSEA